MIDLATAHRQWDICPWCGRVGHSSYHGGVNLSGFDSCSAMRDGMLPEMVPKDLLEHGSYYHGTCRNGRVARWSYETRKFTHIRVKSGRAFPETIGYWTEAQPGEFRFDEFRPYGKLEIPPFEIPMGDVVVVAGAGRINILESPSVRGILEAED